MLQSITNLYYKYIGRNTEYYDWFLINIILHPQTVYESCKYQHSLTQQWNRRDHAITKIVTLFNIILSFIFSITFVSLRWIIPYILFDVIIPMIIGIIIAVILFYLCKSSFTTGDSFTVRYSYDIHINAYFCYLLISHVLIFILSPFLFKPTLTATLFSNIITCLSIIYYIYITYLGYSILPFIYLPKKVYIIPMLAVSVLFILFTVFNLNVALLFL
ncbi:hypothetical protein ENUP19_0347G0010 [Entamoeba nuttalli]|uniref:Yip1 domain containing protein n=2 Tax=Entamoeba nuttalli TaxID=412467 RepID=K2HIR0_ENTNP|nr:hypothetical protein ENU1_005130 [Entamoeba nuttalli P19]EKE42909.1 hypothetical protein ENU1_005130 [Entamoeba nuttalli P19]|eukprot:XP_008854754.1 hypothetical protein ENU1_005130 [Entamoeba nuttalli P19]